MNEIIEHTSDASNRIMTDGSAAFDRGEWSDAYRLLFEADKHTPLAPSDLERFAKSAYMLGKEQESSDILTRAHKRFLDDGDNLSAARSAYWLGFTLLLRGEFAQGGGWVSRAARLLESEGDCVEKGYLLLPDGYRAVQFGDPVEGYRKFHEAEQFGHRFNDPDLRTFGLNGQGRALIRQGEIQRGLSLLDEAMVAVTAGEVSPMTAGGVYCSVIEACSDLFDMRRAKEWTEALNRWCNSQSDELPYRGPCMLHRAEILQLHGSWLDATEEAVNAHQRFSASNQMRLAGEALYRIAELNRLQGKLDAAEEAYKKADQCGANVQPGLAHLRLAQGQTELAAAAIRSLIQDSPGIRKRANLLDSAVEILLAAREPASARIVADELMHLADKINTPLLCAMAGRAVGAVLLAEGSLEDSVVILRRSLDTFQQLEVPYEEARVRILLAQACRNQEDCDTAELELEAGRRIFERLGADHDCARLSSLSDSSNSNGAQELTRREIEVLRLIATGLTNKAIASKLFISEKTVARHVSNIFTKLDLSSRSAVTAHAYRHHLL